MRPGQAPQRSLVLALVLVTASFFAASAYSQFWVSGIHKSAIDIASNTAPSIERLAAMRAEESAFISELRGMSNGRKPYDGAVVQQRKQTFDRSVASYLAVAAAADPRISIAAKGFDEAADHVIVMLEAGDAENARQAGEDELFPATSALSTAILAAMTDASQEAAALANRIESRRESSSHIAWALNLLCAGAAVFAAIVVLRVLRAYGAVVESRNELLARRADELETFASRVAHDIVNPLGTIKMGLEIVDQRSSDDRDKPIIARTLSSVDRALAMVRDLLTFARAGTAPSPDAKVGLRHATSSLAEELSEEARAAGITLKTNDVPDCTVACSPGILSSILSNLVRNGIKYASGRDITISGNTDGGYVEVEVADTGPGIAHDKLGIIWLPYVRNAGAERPGMGLGLATVKRLVEAHGGTVDVRSEQGQGSVFSFRLPTCPPCLEAREARAHQAQGA